MISIYHYADAKSDKIWAIDMDVNPNGSHSVYFGKRTAKLRHKEIQTNSPMKNALAKLNDGYGAVTGSIVNGKYEELDVIPSDNPLRPKRKKIVPKAIFDFATLQTDKSAFY